jgi:2-polyprenyl-3-methyl-5-hydroxy-6-metoxy-1,4-benzoquinol methylase
MTRRRVLVLVVAYEAESTVASVLDRIPDEVLSTYDTEVLLVDDASSDETFTLGIEYRDRNRDVPITVLRNRVNQGYGGNQKVGYAYAIEHGFDVVAMLHGDGQYAPEALPDLLAALEPGVGAVFGSRMSQRGAALRGGMPRYKYLGNRVLTTFQNALLRTDLSEFHSGYRVYNVAALSRVHFRLNTNDFHFDTEILLQLMSAGYDIRERPIPTYYGDEISRVNGLRYAADVARVTLQFALHRMGLRQQRRFDPAVDGHGHYELKLGYESSHQWALDAVPAGASVLDIGAGPGGVAQELVDRGHRVGVVDQHAPDPAVLRSSSVEVQVADLDEPVALDLEGWDVLLLLDVIEHLARPEEFLERLRAQLTNDTKQVVLTTPNVAFIVTRLALLLGQFNYGRSGILDRTHTRLFTFRTLRHLLRDAGMEITEMRGIPAPVPLAIGDGRLARFLLRCNMWLIRLSRSLFSYQIFVAARTSPDLEFLLEDAERGIADSEPGVTSTGS